MKLSGWGRYPIIDAEVHAPRDLDGLIHHVKQGNAIARGNGRSYGDSAVSISNTIHMKHFNRMLAFDKNTGQLVAEAGVLLADIIDIFLPRGWFPFVTPGTKFVTLGGMIATDVHGKNHHKDGSFVKCLDWVEVVTANGRIQRCSPTENKDFFSWIVGGMGLSGIILRAAIRLRPISSAWIHQKTLVAENILQTIELFENNNNSTYSVAWIDCLQTGNALGRSLLMLGEHAESNVLPANYSKLPLQAPRKRKLSIPIEFPNWILNKHSVRAFNELYFQNGKRKTAHQLIDWDSYFYPLDSVLSWNKIYGRRGFAQFQCVIPLDKSEEALTQLLTEISGARTGSFLAVLKRFGEQKSSFSFPMEGYSLALDFPLNNNSLALMEKLDAITLQHGGRFYLAKDSRMSSKTFLESEPRAANYLRYRHSQGDVEAFSSSQSERLGL